ncbi:MAG TPA: hypothetical protein VID47_06095 [Actinomycetota bacterium]
MVAWMVAIVLAAVGVGAFVTESRSVNQAKAQAGAAIVAVRRAHATIGSLESRVAALQARADRAAAQISSLLGQIHSSVGDLHSPRFVLWDTCDGSTHGCPLTPGWVYVGGVPDTFTYHVNFHSTVPVTVRIMSTGDYVCWSTGTCQAHWVGWDNRTKLTNGVFHDAEGCAAYLAVFTADQYGTFYPDIRITRNPAQIGTGVCR